MPALIATILDLMFPNLWVTNPTYKSYLIS